MPNLSRADGFLFVQMPYSQPLIGDYLPARLTYDGYPDLLPSGETGEAIAVSAVLSAYNWPKTNVDRYRRVQRFVDALFTKIGEFQKPPRHPKWREVNLAATLPGWERFEAAQAWLDGKGADEAQAEVRPELRQTAAAGRVTARSGSPANVDPALYQEFLRWRQARPGQGR